MNYACIPVEVDQNILDATMKESNLFGMLHKVHIGPYWTKKMIKREYGNHPAIYLDVWVPKNRLFNYKVTR